MTSTHNGQQELPSEILRAASQPVCIFLLSNGLKAPDGLGRLAGGGGRKERTEPLLGLGVGAFNDL